MIEQSGLRRALESAGLAKLAGPLMASAQRIGETNPHGEREKWRGVVERLTDLTASSRDFTRPAVRIGDPRDCDDQTRARIKGLLLRLKPWRKGPFELFGVTIDSEWRADLKWRRLAEKITSLRGRRVLDVGCGNGYYLWRMLGQGASIALGIDPGQLFIAQFNALKRYCPDCPAFVLPLKSEQFPVGNGASDPGGRGGDFDTVFSMGVLPHRRDPHGHLRELLRFVRPDGELIIEGLVVNGDKDTVLIPAGRYAKMRNIHAIPSPLALEAWLQKSGAGDIELLDVSKTTAEEQRATEWMQFESLADFLDPKDASKTIEGHPAPQRGIFLCRRPD